MKTIANMDFHSSHTLKKKQPTTLTKARRSQRATLLLVWDAHLNLQQINAIYWSYYVLKYAMKFEPHSPINLNKKNAKCLGLHRASDTQLKLISSLIIAKPVSPSEATFACLQIPIIQKNIVVKYIDSKPPTLWTRMITRSRVLGFHSIDIYCNRPHEYDDMTFID